MKAVRKEEVGRGICETGTFLAGSEKDGIMDEQSGETKEK